MSRIVKLLLAVNLIGLAVLTFVYPNLMVGPGKLIAGHKQLEGDCFACHTAFTGANSLGASATGTYRKKREVEAMFPPKQNAGPVTSSGSMGR